MECSCCLVTSCFKLINSKELAPCAKECVRGKIDAQPFFLSLGPWQHESQCFHDSSDSSTFLAWKLVGGFNHCEKYEFVNWDDYPQYMEKKMFQTTNQLDSSTALAWKSGESLVIALFFTQRNITYHQQALNYTGVSLIQAKKIRSCRPSSSQKTHLAWELPMISASSSCESEKY